MNINELTPDEQYVLSEIAQGNYVGNSGRARRALEALERLGLIENRGDHWVVSSGTKSLVRELPREWP